ncbi:tetratricopeptide repeat protein [Pseudomonas sp. St29]|uniref:tetratricopeptide repeat protein n=1 Tax=Pseudomonas sp. St29 TaxID=1500687 RepID=UPI0005FC6443|nr:hypothetical protein [Pseudomonas sp. St29]BAQ82006.1 uncharacterized protein PST29_4117 [Pseudomonas sp. St29]
MRTLLFVCILLWNSISYASIECDVDLNGDGQCDSYSVVGSELDSELSEITIKVGGAGQERKGVFSLGNGGLLPGYIPGDFSLLLDFYTRNTDLTKYDFRWVPALKDWVLYKTSTWVEPSRDERYSLDNEVLPDEARFPQQFHVRRIKCCALFSEFLGNGPALQELSSEDAAREVSKDLQFVLENYRLGEGGSLLYTVDDKGEKRPKVTPRDFLYEMTLVLGEDNVSSMSDYADFLYQNENFVMSAFLLREIHRKYPERVEATVSLADAYSRMGMQEEACSLYKEYLDKMRALGREDKVSESSKSKARCM